jgi:hypothetical protein
MNAIKGDERQKSYNETSLVMSARREVHQPLMKAVTLPDLTTVTLALSRSLAPRVLDLVFIDVCRTPVRRKFVLKGCCVSGVMRFSPGGKGPPRLVQWFRDSVLESVVHRGEVSKLLSGVFGPAGHDVGGCVASGCGGRSSRGRTYADRESIAAALFISLSATGVLVLVAFVLLQWWRPLPIDTLFSRA